MSNIAEQIANTGDDFAVVSPSQLLELRRTDQVKTPPYNPNKYRPVAAHIITDHGKIDVYTSVIIEDEWQTFKYRNKLPPHLLKEWFEQIYELAVNKAKDGETGEQIIAIYKDIKLPYGQEITLNRKVKGYPKEVQDTEIDLVEEMKDHLKHELHRKIDEAYYTNDN